MVTLQCEPIEAAQPACWGRRAALVVTHPGHELFVHAWMESARPVVFVLTDATGTSTPYLPATAEVVERAGCRLGPLFGRCTDAGLRLAVLNADHERFVSLAAELADDFVREDIDCVVGDAAEGHNLSHDVCRLIIDAAVAQASRRRPTLKNYELVLNAPIVAAPAHLSQRSLRLQLDPEAWARKYNATFAYAEPTSDVAWTVEHFGLDSLQTEHLRPAIPWRVMQPHFTPNYHDRSGSRSLSAPSVTLFRDRLLPLAEALRVAAASGLARAA
jgi:hypothetical protein